MPLEFSLRFLASETYSPWAGVVCMILHLAVLVQCRLVTDAQTDGRTHDDSTYRASIASRGKNVARLIFAMILCPLQTDFNHSFTNKLKNNLGTKLLNNSLPHHKCIATLSQKSNSATIWPIWINFFFITSKFVILIFSKKLSYHRRTARGDNISWNLVKCFTTVRKIPFEKTWMT